MASVLCACFLLFAGCGEGGPLGGSGDNSVKATEGVKTLSKPATYEISEAIGENSVNFYNLFSREVMAGLYGVFADPINEYVTDNADKLFAGVAAESGTYTYNADMGNAADKQKFYLFDGMRYAIKSVDAETAGSARIVLDAANPWKWTVPYDAANSKIIFLENATSSDTSDLSQATFNFNGTFSESWTDLYDSASQPDFAEFYYSGEEKLGDSVQEEYWQSPYYQSAHSESVTAQNFFQDALEYAVHLFVLGFDYVDAQGQPTEFAPYFDFQIEVQPSGANAGEIVDVKVGGWEDNPISVSLGENAALGRVKKIYESQGKYIGLTDARDDSFVAGDEAAEGNVQQIERFIKDKVIGSAAWGTGANAGGQFEVQLHEGASTRTLNFDRNYEAVIRNIVDHACTCAPIGESDGQPLPLNKAFLMAQITDYDGNYFEPYFSQDENGIFHEDDLFRYIDAGEYQSLIFMPNEEKLDAAARDNFKVILTSLKLYFEYWDGMSETYEQMLASATDQVYAREIKINVGFRYFDHNVGDYTASGEETKIISFGRFPKYNRADVSGYQKAYSAHTVTFASTSTGGCVPVTNGEKIPLSSKFDGTVCGGPINAFVNGEEIEGSNGKAFSMPIRGTDSTKEFYSLNKSSSGGFFGALNSKKFAGAAGCDFIEVYFDIVKDDAPKDLQNINYSFKVCEDFMTLNDSVR